MRVVNRDTLPDALAAAGIGYRHLAVWWRCHRRIITD